MRTQNDNVAGLRADRARFPRRAAEFFAGSEPLNRIILSKDRGPSQGYRTQVNVGHQPMSMENTRVSVILGICQQDPDRWHEFDAIYRPILFAYVRKRGLNDFDADEVVQEIFVKLLDKIRTYDRTRSRFRAWLFSVAHNAVVDSARRRAAHAKALDGWAVEMLHASPTDSQKMSAEFLKIHRSKILKHALKTVRAGTSSKVWTCFEQRLLRDRPGADIARDLGILPNAVYVNACRVLKQVRAVCQEFDEDLSDDFDASLSQRD